jgi:RNA polymerase sigma factor (sigma-70 family)
MSNGSLTEISRRIARRLGRSPETVRYTIKNFDRQHPGDALFPTSSGPVPEEAKQSMFSLFRRGIGVESLSQQFRRNRGVIYRAIHEMQARQLLSQASEPVPHLSFDDPAAAAAILAPMPDAEAYEAQRAKMKAPKDVPPELAPLYEVPLLNKEQEQHLFRQMNFLKHKAWKLREQIDPKHARTQDLEKFRDLHRQAQQVKERLINCNMRLVVSVAKRHAQPHENFFELLSDGNMSLIRAVDKFDFSRGNKFSTYATWAIMKNFARSIPGERHHRERFVTGHEEMFEATADKRSSEHEQLAHQEQSANRVNHLLEALEPRLRQIIRMRAGLDNSEGMTLEEIGQVIGVTKERVRQLNVRAMNQLRSMARDQRVDMP